MRATAAVLTMGAQTFGAALRSLRDQPCDVEVVAHVRPFAAAMNEAVARCRTELLVQVDEDMVLRSNAIARLVAFIDATPPDVVMACAPLWDQDLEQLIYGIKIYRRALLPPFEDSPLGDTHDRAVWAARGLAYAKMPLEEANCVGLHGTHYTPEQAFARWRGLWRRHRMTNKAAWIEPWLEKLAKRYRRSGSRRDLYAMLGAYVGATESLESPSDVLSELIARVPQ